MPPTTAPTTAPTPSPTTAPTTVYIFGGSTGTLNAVQGQTPPAVNLAAYRNISVSIQFGPVVRGSGTLNLSDATNNGDVSPNTLPADNATAGFTPFIYISVYSTSPPTFLQTPAFEQTPQLALTDSAGFGGRTTCKLDEYTLDAFGTGPYWFFWDNATGTISGNSVTIAPANFPVFAGNYQSFYGQRIFAVACK